MAIIVRAVLVQRQSFIQVSYAGARAQAVRSSFAAFASMLAGSRTTDVATSH